MVSLILLILLHATNPKGVIYEAQLSNHRRLVLIEKIYRPRWRARAERIAKAAQVVAPQSQVSTHSSSESVVADWNAIAQCESSGHWSDNTGNGYYGGLQIDLHNWHYYGGLAYAARPDLASPNEQIAIATKILADQGEGAWPVCFTG